MLLEEDAGGAVPSAVRHSVLRRVSVDVLVDLDGAFVESVSVEVAVLSVELGVFVALGVFAVEEDSGMLCVVVDSVTRLCS
ncbi:MAG: hypothetical protein ABW110_06165 [Steroidobacteraceae bacterium]